MNLSEKSALPEISRQCLFCHTVWTSLLFWRMAIQSWSETHEFFIAKNEVGNIGNNGFSDVTKNSAAKNLFLFWCYKISESLVWHSNALRHCDFVIGYYWIFKLTLVNVLIDLFSVGRQLGTKMVKQFSVKERRDQVRTKLKFFIISLKC